MIDSRGSHARLCMWPASPKPETDPVLAGLQPSDSSDRSSETPFLRSQLSIRRAPLRIQCPRWHIASEPLWWPVGSGIRGPGKPLSSSSVHPLVGPWLCSPSVNRCLHCPWVGPAVPCSLSAAQLTCVLGSLSMALPTPPPGSLSASLLKPAPSSWSLTLAPSTPWPLTWVLANISSWFPVACLQCCSPDCWSLVPHHSCLTHWIQEMLTAYRGVLPPASRGILPPMLASSPVSQGLLLPPWTSSLASRGLLPYVTAVLSPSRPASPFSLASWSSFLPVNPLHPPVFFWTLSWRKDFSILLLN